MDEQVVSHLTAKLCAPVIRFPRIQCGGAVADARRTRWLPADAIHGDPPALWSDFHTPDFAISFRQTLRASNGPLSYPGWHRNPLFPEHQCLTFAVCDPAHTRPTRTVNARKPAVAGASNIIRSAQHGGQRRRPSALKKTIAAHKRHKNGLPSIVDRQVRRSGCASLKHRWTQFCAVGWRPRMPAVGIISSKTC